MPDYREQAEQLLADYRRSREQLAAVHGELTAISEQASSPDGLITATVGARGTLTGLSIDDATYRSYRPAELAEQIVRVTAQATVHALQRAGEKLAPALGDDADPQALLLGTADLRADEFEAQHPGTPARTGSARRGEEELEDAFEEQSWVREA